MNTRRNPISRLSLWKAINTIEFLEPRSYLSAGGGVVFQTPGVSTSAAAAGISPNFATFFDFNGDGKADLVTANTDNTVSVLLGNGDGTFHTPATNIAVGTHPIPLAIDNINGDGKPDIVTGNDNNVTVILGNGNGTFGAPTNVAALSSNSAIGVGDFNNDNRADIVVVNKSASAAANDRVGILFQNPDGSFTLSRLGSITHTTLDAVAVGDFAGSGSKQDIAIVDQKDNLVTVILGNGDGTFQAPVDYATSSGPTSIVASDFNGDGNIDLVTSDSTGQAVSFLKNNGDGTFAAPVNSGVAGTPVNGGPLKVRLTNINGDANTDLIVLDSFGSSADATVLLGNGDGTFHTGTTIATGGATRTSIATGDLNNDGFTDAVVADPTNVTALINVTNQDNTPPTASVPASQPTPVAGAVTYQFTVTYTDNTQIDASTVGDTNLTVTGPNGFSQQPTLVSQNVGNAATVTVTYQLSFPAGLAATDSGTYTVHSNGDSGSTTAVKDANGNPLAAGVIGSLTLNVDVQQVTPPPQSVQIATLVKKATLKPGKAKTFVFSKYFFPNVDGDFFLLVTVTSANGATLSINSVTTKSPTAVVAGAKGKAVKFKVVDTGGTIDSKDVLTFTLSASPTGATNATPITYNIQPAFVDLVNQWDGVLPATLPAAGKKESLIVPVLDAGNVKAKGTVDVTITPILNGVAQTPIIVAEKVSLTNGKTKKLHVKFVVPTLASGTYTMTLNITPVLGFTDSDPSNDTVASANSFTI